MQTRITPIILALVALVALPATAGAVPLDKPACDSLKTEHAALLAGGLEADMARGPEWAKANLAPERLKLIERLIEVEEQLSFRCGEIVTARPLMKEPPKPEKSATQRTKKKESVAETSGDANTPPAAGQPPAKKKKPAAAKATAKGKESAAAAGTNGLP